MSSGAGHNLSQGDLESESESEKYPRGANTGTGCYKNYEHHPAMHRRSNKSNQVETQLVHSINFLKNLFNHPQQNSVPDPDIQSTYSPSLQRQKRQEDADQNMAADNDTNNGDDEQLIEDESETPQNHPYMRATKLVSMKTIFHYSHLDVLISLSINC